MLNEQQLEQLTPKDLEIYEMALEAADTGQPVPFTAVEHFAQLLAKRTASFAALEQVAAMQQLFIMGKLPRHLVDPLKIEIVQVFGGRSFVQILGDRLLPPEVEVPVGEGEERTPAGLVVPSGSRRH